VGEAVPSTRPLTHERDLKEPDRSGTGCLTHLNYHIPTSRRVHHKRCVGRRAGARTVVPLSPADRLVLSGYLWEVPAGRGGRAA